MITVGAFDAKTHLSALLDKVESGEEVVITRHGKAIARLIPEAVAGQSRLGDTVRQLKALREEQGLDGLSWKDLRDEGRK